LSGVDPDIAVLWNTDTILVREGTDPLPAAIERSLELPSCDQADEPIELSGMWIGILGADGNTELDMDPPYDVEMLVDTSSSPAYERAQLTIRVPASLGRPLTRDDVGASLWKGGRIAVSATCRGDGFVASEVAADPAE